MPKLRADAQRNYARLLAAAEVEVATHGGGASLEAIARAANVGSATARRHFPTRRALLEAVSHSRIEVLSARAQDLRTANDGREALLEWLDLVMIYCVDARGLADALSYDDGQADPVRENSCAAALEQAGQPLLRRAVEEGSVSRDASVGDLIALVVGIALVTATQPDPAARAHRLLRLAVGGLGPSTTASSTVASASR